MANPTWCAGCGGGEGERYATVKMIADHPYCQACADRRYDNGAIRPDGNAMNAGRNPEGWAEWLRISESWGYP